MIREDDFYIGMDFGHYSVTTSYIDQHSNQPILMDRSGGFGQVYIPTYMMYQAECNEWYIGEDVVGDTILEGDVFVDNVMTYITEKKKLLTLEKK